MKKIMRIVMMVFLPFLLCAGITLPVHAMSDEEKELFDMLGAEYVLDENGDFKEFIANESLIDELMSRFTVEQKMALAKEYEGKTQVGKYQVCIGTNEAPDIANIMIKDQNGNPVFLVDNCQTSGASTVYINADQNFFALHYEDPAGENFKSYTLGNMNTDEKSQYNPMEEYIRNEDGAFQLSHKRDDEKQYNYDENGGMYEWEDLATGIVYAADSIDGILEQKRINAVYADVREAYDLPDEIQRLVDGNNGSLLVYREDLDEYVTMPEIDEWYCDSRMAGSLGMSLEEYREKYSAYAKYASKVQGAASIFLADILEVPKIHYWNKPEPLAAGEIPSAISPTGVAQELTALINNYRAAKGLQPLDTSDPLLQQVADLRAQEAAYVMDSDHSRPMAGKAAESFCVGENLAMTAFSQGMSNKEIAQRIFVMWKRSPGHNANMLREEYQAGALGVWFVKENGWLLAYASHDFSYMSDYQNMISDTVKKRIAIGAQVPGNIESVKDYYLKLYDTTMPSNDGIIWNLDIDPNKEDTESAGDTDSGGNKYGYQLSEWYTDSRGGRCFYQPLTGDAVAINGITPAIVCTEIKKAPDGEQIWLLLCDADFNRISYEYAQGFAYDIEHTKYKYVHFMWLDFIGDEAVFEVRGTDSPRTGNLVYMGEGTWDTVDGQVTGSTYVDKGWYGIGDME